MKDRAVIKLDHVVPSVRPDYEAREAAGEVSTGQSEGATLASVAGRHGFTASCSSRAMRAAAGGWES